MGRIQRLVAVLAVFVLSGCLQGLGPTTDTVQWADQVGPDEVEPMRPYAFRHGGGDLVLGAEGHVIVTLFDHLDRRRGTLELGSAEEEPLPEQANPAGSTARTSGRSDRQGLLADRPLTLPDAQPGEYVVLVLGGDGRLAITSDGDPVAFRPLNRHMERTLLVDHPFDETPTSGFFPPLLASSGEEVHVDLSVELLRIPLALRILAAGSGSQVAITIDGSGGILYDRPAADYSARFGNDIRLQEIGGTFNADRARSGSLEIRIDAIAVEGILVLETYSYSRFLPTGEVAQGDADARAEEIPFVYGRMPKGPVAIDVHPDASYVALWVDGDEEPRMDHEERNETERPPPAESGDEALPLVRVYGPDDVPVTAVAVPPGRIVRVPVVAGGEYVLVTDSDTLAVGTDVVPVDFALRPLDVLVTVAPTAPAGDRYEYRSFRTNVTVPGVPFDATYTLHPPTASGAEDVGEVILGTCFDEGSIRLLVANETLGFWGDGIATDDRRVRYHLPPGPVEFVQDGFDGRCGHTAMEIRSYRR